MSVKIFEEMEKHGHEQVIFNYDKTTGLKAIIAVHDTTLGPALGGCRMLPYETEEEALDDVLRLSKGMTYKCSISEVDYGGGKTVIIGDPEKDKSEGMFRALGRFVGTMKGRYYTGTDVGTVPDDFVHSYRESDYFVGLPEEFGGSGNSAINTAFGTLMGIKACVKEHFGQVNLEGKKIAIQGLGKVGQNLVDFLMEEGAHIIATDISKDNINQVKERHSSVEMVEPDAIYEVDCDIFSPNALGAVINDFTVEKLKCSIIAGAANNQLKEEKHGRMLFDKGILYAPDYIVNAGGLIQVSDEIGGHNKDRIRKKTERIYDILLQVFKISREENITPQEASDKLVEERIATVKGLQSNYMG
ncbi:Leu/Phe/Val dehydrogenase [Natranaerobius thermophilus]|uniref:Leucine dehydrogenase n=1 Tax=Natranaerobius thermophilus (strain ATCC BAA-1301 / DSM 18059 / JW/NM-WN-LF) TaxID=457570 RepID=B2A8N1_NATTJ|nr:Glu/Leu/Phe/Val dehydrogenase [Natranaerobius thermophilus]ACB85914.1 leucine dehydrogenase [Natranaerobius thermophilus JW/NM-WN-LF]